MDDVCEGLPVELLTYVHLTITRPSSAVVKSSGFVLVKLLISHNMTEWLNSLGTYSPAHILLSVDKHETVRSDTNEISLTKGEGTASNLT